jgi:hypothetical protein
MLKTIISSLLLTQSAHPVILQPLTAADGFQGAYCVALADGEPVFAHDALDGSVAQVKIANQVRNLRWTGTYTTSGDTLTAMTDYSRQLAFTDGRTTIRFQPRGEPTGTAGAESDASVQTPVTATIVSPEGMEQRSLIVSCGL